MVPNIVKGKGISGAVKYVMNPKRDDPANTERVGWIGGQGLGFAVRDADDVSLARRIMEFMGANQTSKTRKCAKDCLHLSLSWAPDEQPDAAEMEAAARDALAALGMETAAAIFVQHTDTLCHHVHIVASRINPATGKAFSDTDDIKKVQAWALAYEQAQQKIRCTKRLAPAPAPPQRQPIFAAPLRAQAFKEWHTLRALGAQFKQERADL